MMRKAIKIDLMPGAYYKFILDPFRERAFKSRKLEEAGIILTSEEDICVHGINFDYMTYGGFNAQPLMSFSTSFYIPGYTINSGLSQFLIAAFDDQTHVKVTIREKGIYQNETDIVLGKFQTYVFSDPLLDYTGSYIESDKPVGVFAGVDCGKVPIHTEFCDNIVVGVPPVKSLGNSFIVAPLADRQSDTGYVVRTMATEDNTTITNNGETRFLSRGDHWNTDVERSSHIMNISCSRPCLVVQYSKGSSKVIILVY